MHVGRVGADVGHVDKDATRKLLLWNLGFSELSFVKSDSALCYF